MKWKYIVQKIVILQNIPLRSGNFTQDVLAFFNDVMGLEVNSYDLKACHPLGPVSQNQNCVVIVKFVYFDIKKQNFMAAKSYLKIFAPCN